MHAPCELFLDGLDVGMEAVSCELIRKVRRGMRQLRHEVFRRRAVTFAQVGHYRIPSYFEVR